MILTTIVRERTVPLPHTPRIPVRREGYIGLAEGIENLDALCACVDPKVQLEKDNLNPGVCEFYLRSDLQG